MNKGDVAPDFTLPATEGGNVNLYAELKTKQVVLFFYLRAFTPVCTTEACCFQHHLPAFETAGALVLGVSSDSESVARQFKQRHHLQFPLLLDRDGQVRRSFQVPRVLSIIPGRSTFVIGRDRRIAGVTHAQTRGSVHVEESLRFLLG